MTSDLLRVRVRCCRKVSGRCFVFSPIIWAHPPVEYAHRPVTQAGDDERPLGVAGKAGHTAVCSRRDVLVETYEHTHTHPPKNRKVVKRNLERCLGRYIAHFSLNLLGNHQSCAPLTAGSFQVGAGINMQPQARQRRWCLY